MNSKKRIVSSVLSIVMLMSVFTIVSMADASTLLQNRDGQIEQVYKDIVFQLKEDYKGIYKLDNFSYDYSER